MDRGTVGQYDGRTFDVLALQGVKQVGNAALDLSFVGDDNGGLVCTGIQRLAQLWLTQFLLMRGTKKYRPNEGTEFVTLLKSGSMRTALDARTAFAIAASAVQQTLDNMLKGDEPLDEQLDSVELLAVSISGKTLTLKIRIVSRDPARQVILPVAVAV